MMARMPVRSSGRPGRGWRGSGAALRQAFLCDDVSVGDIGAAFERLRLSLARGAPADERVLASLVNAIEVSGSHGHLRQIRSHQPIGRIWPLDVCTPRGTPDSDKRPDPGDPGAWVSRAVL